MTETRTIGKHPALAAPYGSAGLVGFQFKIVPAPYDKPAWYGKVRYIAPGSHWVTVATSYGKVLYTTPQAALAGAMLLAEDMK